ncbi:hypothetical protein BO70DRAFT_353756 [Aspergillus heteromorphus CBS 117.55]|uniref:Nucleotide-diphospho-sugar transferase n=1 Tax=Aspergillus heteromorphus CBS 117.55 TaxID=1448321 RepID=A0A317VZE6_9EURO|nr:uncharacterized protein BO70DRAFT_353756 [Aspergillus heteromorphus CBS 117.55]PWY78337.1 hypothetical protein BO70DRAFT_353756 [Aspergillus heteromorphus CBS 117.55]
MIILDKAICEYTCKFRCARSFDVTVKAWEAFRWVRDAVQSKTSLAQGACMREAPLLEFNGRALQEYHGSVWPGTYVESIEVPSDLTEIGVSIMRERESLNLWKLTEYEKITFIDADTIILQPLDDVFTDATAALQEAIPYRGSSDTAYSLPESYLIAGVHDIWVEWALPPSPGREQNLLIYAHKTDDRMPWRELSPDWNQKPLANNKGDLPKFKSLHQKWWRSVFDQEIDYYIGNVTQEMDIFHRSSSVDTEKATV